jgi:hypothetical protein
MRERLTELLTAADPKVAAVATATEAGRPAAAVCSFAVREDGRIIIATHRSSHKWQNLQANPELALTVGQDMRHPHLQVGGSVELQEGDAASDVADFHFGVHPESKAFMTGDDSGFVVVTPTWARITVFKPDGPPEIEEGAVEA